MKYSVIFAAQAERDLRGIFEYIAYSLGSPKNAAAQLDRIEKRINSLEQLPERYPLYSKEPWHSRGLRLLPVDNFCVFYFADNCAAKVFILRIMYGKRDIDMVLCAP